MTVERLPDPRPKAREEGLAVERVDDEVLIYDLERDRAHRLNETAALVFEHCDGERDPAGLAELLSEKSGGPVDEGVVRAALVRLSDARLLDERVGPADGDGWSRRQALRKIGAAGAVAGLGLPVVKSIVAPTPAAAQASCAADGERCGTVTGPNECAQDTCCLPGRSCIQVTGVPGCTCQD
jgi:coenzyme PQQ synthesis protein D (PqqD)